MKKKLLALTMSAMMAFAAVGCGSTDSGSSDGTNDVQTGVESSETADASGENTVSGENHKVGISLAYLSADWFVELADNATAAFEAAGMEVTTVSCEGNAAQQVTDVENLITSGCDILIIGAADPGTIQGTMEQAIADGLVVLTWGFDEEAEGIYSVNMTSAQSKVIGEITAQMAVDWVDETFPDAEDGSIKTAILGFSVDEENTKRDDGLQEISDMSSKIDLVDFYDFGTDISDEKTTSYIEMLLDRYPDIQVIIGHDSAQATVVNEVIMRTAGLDTEKIGVFAAGTSQDSLATLQDSANGTGVVKGLVDLGDIGTAFYDAYVAYLNGELTDTNGCYELPMNTVTGENVADYIK